MESDGASNHNKPRIYNDLAHLQRSITAPLCIDTLHLFESGTEFSTMDCNIVLIDVLSETTNRVRAVLRPDEEMVRQLNCLLSTKHASR